jgi:hypothetical protein
MNPTTTPTVPAGEIFDVWISADWSWSVDYSIDTPHQCVAVVKMQDLTGYYLAVWDAERGVWTRARYQHHPKLTAALAAVSGLVATTLV